MARARVRRCGSRGFPSVTTGSGSSPPSSICSKREATSTRVGSRSSGVSQAGYWVPRSVAFEKRIAAAVADPGVFDVSTAWTEKLPKGMMKLIEAGEREKFERNFRFAEHFMGKTTRQTLAFRMKPYQTESMFDSIQAVRAYRLDDVVDRITTPMLITDPEDEQFWPGQSRRLYDALPGPDKVIVRFTAEEGANFHCEPTASALFGQRVFDWLDEKLQA